jgi:hypothetical protein
LRIDPLETAQILVRVAVTIPILGKILGDNMDKYIQSLPKTPQNPWELYEKAKRWYSRNFEFSVSEYDIFIRKVTERLGI